MKDSSTANIIPAIGMRTNKSAQPVARDKMYACHGPCLRTARAKHTSVSPLTFGKKILRSAFIKMKKQIATSILFFASLGAAYSDELPRFEDSKIEIENLSLSESFSAPGIRIIKDPKIISHMPVIREKAGVEDKIGIKMPDSKVEYSLITKDVDMTLGK